ncbi:MAG: GNAT family N-acetyltransferase [Chloroflexi bacterium]|nr:MAG: GNAT family N-acetyltransferase [Chloroflexota bacterium]
MDEVMIRPFTLNDHANAIALWRQSEGVGLSSADEKPAIAKYLARNPGMSFVAFYENQLVGAILCGHDGRRGYIHHLAVHPEFRRSGIGQQLVAHGLSALAEAGIDKCHLFIFHKNESGKAFWESIGYSLRMDIQIMSKLI